MYNIHFSLIALCCSLILKSASSTHLRKLLGEFHTKLTWLMYREIEKLHTSHQAIIFCWFNAQTTRHTTLTVNVYNLAS